MPAKALHPFVLFHIPYTHSPVLPAAREVLPVRAEREHPHLVRVPLRLAPADVARLALALALVYAGLVECVRLAASP